MSTFLKVTIQSWIWRGRGGDIHHTYKSQFLSLIILSVRTDRLSDPAYLSRHWRHFGGMLVFAFLAWLPQVLCLFLFLFDVFDICFVLGFSLVIFFRLAGLWHPRPCLFFAELIYGLYSVHFWWAYHCINYYYLLNFILSIKLVDSIQKIELGCSRVSSIQLQLNLLDLLIPSLCEGLTNMEWLPTSRSLLLHHLHLLLLPTSRPMVASAPW